MASRSSAAPFARGVWPAAAALSLVLFVVPAHGGTARRGRTAPDLLFVSISQPASTLAPGSSFLERFREANRGGRRASRSTTSFFLSLSRKLGPGAIPLGSARVEPLKAGAKAGGKATLTIPSATPPQEYQLVGCVNDPHRLKERRTGNDCRGPRSMLTVSSRPNGPSGASPPAPPPGNGPGCPPTREPSLTSSGPDCFDGDVAHGVFVSGVGDDLNPGTIGAPKRTLSAGMAAAVAQKADLYVTEGVFPETLDVADGVSVFGAYNASWQRSPSHITKIVGAPSSGTAALANGIATTTTLQLLTLRPDQANASGASSYGLSGTGSPGLLLDHVTIVSAPGRNGQAGSKGSDGAEGGEGKPGGAGGTSPAGHTGGKGGTGGYDGHDGYEGEAGLLTEEDSWHKMGGPGGPGGEGGSNPKPGGPGYAGDSGTSGADGAGGGSGSALPPGFGSWLTKSGQPGQSGSSGHGGGGGGGGGSDGCTFGERADGGYGGGGGGGGSGGHGGGAGQGGGGSFGIFLGNSTGAVVRDSSVSASGGGNGGAGGEGGYGGPGGAYGAGTSGFAGGGLCSAGAAPGGHGGLGGPGGLGGDGGGGSGGPSIAIFGLESSAAPGTTVSHGPGGLGAIGAGGSGADGTAADFG